MCGHVASKQAGGLPRSRCAALFTLDGPAIGLAGAGKTSTLKVLTGDLLPTAGTAHIGGMNVLESQRAVRQLALPCPSACSPVCSCVSVVLCIHSQGCAGPAGPAAHRILPTV